MNFQEWCLLNVEKINLKITKLNWIQIFFPNYYDFSVSIIVDGISNEGFGFNSCQDLALTKAIAEALERSVIKNKLMTSNGIAGHSNFENAKKNALNEIVERDLFLSHFYTKTALDVVSNNEFIIPKKLTDYVESNGDKIRLFKTRKSNLGTTYVCLISNQNEWGGILSIQLANDNSIDEILKCVINASRNYRNLRENDRFQEHLSLDDFLNHKSFTFEDHQKLSLNLNYFNKISFLFGPDAGTIASASIFYEMSQFSYNSIKLSPEISECPLHIVKCENKNLISLTAGHYSRSNIPDDALIRFSGTLDIQLCNLPHPLS